MKRTMLTVSLAFFIMGILVSIPLMPAPAAAEKPSWTDSETGDRPVQEKAPAKTQQKTLNEAKDKGPSKAGKDTPATIQNDARPKAQKNGPGAVQNDARPKAQKNGPGAVQNDARPKAQKNGHGAVQNDARPKSHKDIQPEAKKNMGKTHGKQAQTGHAKGKSHLDYFGKIDRGPTDRYYAKRFNAGKCPPGLSRSGHGCTPPGQDRKWTMNRPLPRNVVFHDLPAEVSAQIGPPPSGYRFVRVAQDILMIAVGTGMVVDAIQDIGSQMNQ